MKRTIILFVFLLGASFLGFSQEKSESQTLTFGKWRIESLDFGSEKVELSKESNWMIFDEKGNYYVIVDDKKLLGSGTWQSNEKGIKFDGDSFSGSSVVKKLSDKEFMFSLTEGNQVCTVKLSK